MLPDKPDISVIIPCAFMAPFLDDAFRSLENQGVGLREVIVVHPPDDAASAAKAESWAGRLPVRLAQHPLSGAGPARNAGYAIAQGELIVFHDADDVVPAGRFARQLNRLERDPPVDAVGGLVVRFDRLDAASLTPSEGASEAICDVSCTTWIFRRSVFDRIGLFDPDLRYAEDWDILLRMRDADIAFTVLDVPALYYRQHAGSTMASGDPQIISDLHKAMFRSILRRRKAGLPPASGQLLHDRLERTGSQGAEA